MNMNVDVLNFGNPAIHVHEVKHLVMANMNFP